MRVGSSFKESTYGGGGWRYRGNLEYGFRQSDGIIAKGRREVGRE